MKKQPLRVAEMIEAFAEQIEATCLPLGRGKRDAWRRFDAMMAQLSERDRSVLRLICYRVEKAATGPQPTMVTKL